jgi:hypothetical protein
MELCHREVKPYWWCIGHECKHCVCGPISDSFMDNTCAHPDIIKQVRGPRHRLFGYPIVAMNMCPVLCDVKIES